MKQAPLDTGILEDNLTVLHEKEDILRKLDKEVQKLTSDDKELGKEVSSAQAYLDKIVLMKSKVRRHLRESTATVTKALPKPQLPIDFETSTSRTVLGPDSQSQTLSPTWFPQPTPYSSPHTSTKLPTLTMPKFGGELVKWPSFWSQFKASIDDNPTITKMSNMTEDLRSPGLNMEHGFVKKIERNQYMRNMQVREEAMKKSEAAKLAKKVVMQNKPARPTMPIYRPPNKQLIPSCGSRMASGDFQSKNSHNLSPSPTSFTSAFPEFDTPVFTGNRAVHFKDQSRGSFTISFKNQEDTVLNEGQQFLKSALKRSKSFGGNNETAILDAEMGFEKEALSSEYQSLVRKALTDPNALSSRQLMEVVRVLCLQAITAVKSAEPAARMCFKIIEKERNETFLESLLNSCREWFNERDKLRRHHSTGGSWTAYVSFLLELYLKLKDHQRSHTRDNSGVNSDATLASQKLTLVSLIYECCFIILMPPSIGNSAEIECLRSTLTTAGKFLEQDSPEKMERLCFMMKDAFLTVSQEPFRKTLLELIELRASNWEMNLPQTIYYFPYTARLF